MDNLNNNNSSYEVELKSSTMSQQNAELQHHSQIQQPKLISPHRQRAMSFLYCISKRLGRRVQHELVYNSQYDLRSSSTDSFSLSLDRGSEKHIRSSSIDLSSDDQSSRGSSSSSSSRHSSNCGDENEALVVAERQHLHRHSYETHCYHIVDDEDDSQAHQHVNDMTKCTASAANSATRTPLKGLNLNRISISSVSRVLQHISSSSSSSTSMRSLSCNSTPLKRTSESKKSSLSAEKKSADANSSSSAKSKSAKPQQQRILRQPTSYVYLKGISGLPTRRVPRSSVCCGYASCR